MPGRRYDYELILAPSVQTSAACRFLEPCQEHQHCVLVEFQNPPRKPRDTRNATGKPAHVQLQNLRKRRAP